MSYELFLGIRLNKSDSINNSMVWKYVEYKEFIVFHFCSEKKPRSLKTNLSNGTLLSIVTFLRMKCSFIRFDCFRWASGAFELAGWLFLFVWHSKCSILSLILTFVSIDRKLVTVSTLQLQVYTNHF